MRLNSSDGRAQSLLEAAEKIFIAAERISQFPMNTWNARVAFACLAATTLETRAANFEWSGLSNLSVRTTMAADQTLIVGGVVSGGVKTVLIRAGGPALTKFGLDGLADPRLALYTNGSAPVASNDNWPGTLGPVFSAVGAFGFDSGSRDAALSLSLNGAFTVQAAGTGPGTVLVEAYDVTGGTWRRMINLSARNRVGTGSDILIAGFSVGGTGTKNLLIRAVGPGLAAFGVSETLGDPLLQLFDHNGVGIGSNDTWDASLAATFANVGAFGLTEGSKDAAMLVSLAAGNSYTVQVSGADGGTGEALVEIYEIAEPLAEARLPARGDNGVYIGFPRVSDRLKTTGDVRIKTLFVDFDDAVATRTPQSVFGVISPGAENFWKGVSYGRLNVTLDPVFQWLRMSRRSTEYGWSALNNTLHKAYIQEAVNLALAAGADFSSSDAIAVMANPDAVGISIGPTYVANRGLGVVANGRIFDNVVTSGRDSLGWGYKWLNHEGGHMMGLVDLYSYAGTVHRHVGDYSLMGSISGTAPEYFGWERWLLGWLDDDQVICAKSGTTTLVLTPIETAGGRKLVVIPTGATTAVVVESRRSLGFDTALPKSGPLPYLVDTSYDSGGGPIKVLPIDENDTRKFNAPLSVGQTITYNGVSVRFVTADADTVTLEVTRP